MGRARAVSRGVLLQAVAAMIPMLPIILLVCAVELGIFLWSERG